jgi:hypothetical protein
VSHSHLIHSSLSVVSLAALVSVAQAGCARGAAESAELAAYGDDSVQTESNLEAMGQSLVGKSSDSSKLSVQSLVAKNPGGGFYTAGCIVEDILAAKADATVTFTNCTGPWGLVQLNGVVKVTWNEVSATELDLVLSATDFKVNQATITTWTANAKVTSQGDQLTMDWSAHLDGTTGGGRAFTRTNDKTIQWTVGGSCLTINGTSTGTVTGLDLQTTVTNYSRCQNACPAAGSDITVEDVTTGATVDLKYLGGSEAQFTSIRGAVTEFSVACGS